MVNKYLEREFYAACPIMPEKAGIIKMKVITYHGESRWLNITPEQFKMIENVLVYGYDVKKPA